MLNTPDNDSYVLILYFIGLDGYYHSFCHLQEELEDFSAIEAIADYLCGLSFDDIMNSRLELFSEFKFTTYPFTFNIEDIIED